MRHRIFTFRTESGSLYEINCKEMTWERMIQGNQYTSRNPKGRLIAVPDVQVGKRAYLYDDDILPDHIAHCVETTPVVEITEIA